MRSAASRTRVPGKRATGHLSRRCSYRGATWARARECARRPWSRRRAPLASTPIARPPALPPASNPRRPAPPVHNADRAREPAGRCAFERQVPTACPTRRAALRKSRWPRQAGRSRGDRACSLASSTAGPCSAAYLAAESSRWSRRGAPPLRESAWRSRNQRRTAAGGGPLATAPPSTA